MKKLLLFMGIAIIAISCSKDLDLSDHSKQNQFASFKYTIEQSSYFEIDEDQKKDMSELEKSFFNPKFKKYQIRQLGINNFRFDFLEGFEDLFYLDDSLKVSPNYLLLKNGEAELVYSNATSHKVQDVNIFEELTAFNDLSNFAEKLIAKGFKEEEGIVSNRDNRYIKYKLNDDEGNKYTYYLEKSTERPVRLITKLKSSESKKPSFIHYQYEDIYAETPNLQRLINRSEVKTRKGKLIEKIDIFKLNAQ